MFKIIQVAADKKVIQLVTKRCIFLIFGVFDQLQLDYGAMNKYPKKGTNKTPYSFNLTYNIH